MCERGKVKYLKTAVSSICLMVFMMTMLIATLFAQFVGFIASIMTVGEQRSARHFSIKTVTLIRMSYCTQHIKTSLSVTLKHAQ